MGTETVPFDVNEEFEVGDLSDQSGQELLEAAKGVKFIVREAKIQIVEDKESGETLMRKLNIQAKIGPLGVNGEGKYANKVMFAELIAWYNPERYTSDWWKKQSRFPLKSFMQAVGYDAKTLPKFNDQLLEDLKNKEFQADIAVLPIRLKVDGEYQDTGDKKNELKNYKKIQD